jgi:hypothetical protein
MSAPGSRKDKIACVVHLGTGGAGARESNSLDHGGSCQGGGVVLGEDEGILIDNGLPWAVYGGEVRGIAVAQVVPPSLAGKAGFGSNPP